MPTQRLQSASTVTPPAQGYLALSLGAHTETIEIQDFLTLGRSECNMLPIADDFVSARHARIERRNESFYLRDLRSRNGTFLNGTRILEAHLSDGDRIRIGRSELRFQFQRTPHQESLSMTSKNEVWSQQLDRIPSMAESDLPVLILGPSGTGKELLAQLIHKKSLRSYGPFVSVNCSALSESLVESELFGHVKGSFTGATHDRKGAFESARGGTLFLDEIGDLPLSLQPKLLRALENNEIKPVGSDKTIKTDVRIVAATHQNLKQKVDEKQFRSDLFFRLHVLQLSPPALKDRMEDFESLLYQFAKKMRVRFSFQAIQRMSEHSWPGNIRELKNMVARAKALFDGQEILPDHIDQLIDFSINDQPDIDNSQQLPVIKEIERRMIVEQLVAHGGNQRKTALALNMPKSTLHDRIRAYGIDVKKLVHP